MLSPSLAVPARLFSLGMRTMEISAKLSFSAAGPETWQIPTSRTHKRIYVGIARGMKRGNLGKGHQGEKHQGDRDCGDGEREGKNTVKKAGLAQS